MLHSCSTDRRVHLSQATKNFLHGEFELEEGHGGEREDELKKVTTFLVKAVLKPYPEGTLDQAESGTPTKTAANGRSHKPGYSAKPGYSSKEAPADERVSSDHDQEGEGSVDSLTQEEEQRKEFSKRLQRELIERDTER
ncbi:hypothetical protein BsWGS_14505 [Bradybaena similaris]